ncbi:MAG: RNA polymerase subunit sigma [Bacteroidetes bacterium]|nr:MAG: RNA polymerase subunit sigma [Bacteroidota bacterium]
MSNIKEAAKIISNAKNLVAFTGAGISVESGIPPFRGVDGLWAKYDPMILDLDFYKRNPDKSWPIIKELFFDFFGNAKPNAAHYGLAKLEQMGILKSIITQNIDNLHQEAGNKEVYEYHGNSVQFVCTKCGTMFKRNDLELTNDYPLCSKCGGLLKPDFIFFGEGIPEDAMSKSLLAAQTADIFLIIGTTGEIMPASQIPYLAKQNNATIIEINIEKSKFTDAITDIFIQEKATKAMNEIIVNV